MSDFHSISDDVQYVKGIGPNRAKLLKKLDIETVEDLIYFFPRDYQDLRKFSHDLTGMLDERISIKVEVLDQAVVSRPRRGLSIIKQRVILGDMILYLVWFNQDYLVGKYKPGERLNVSGKFKKIGRELQISSPIVEKEGATRTIGKISPIYRLTKGISNNVLTKLVKNALDRNLKDIDETIPSYLIEKYLLKSKKDAISALHHPKSNEDLEEAIYRFKFEELLVLQSALLVYKRANNEAIGTKINDDGRTGSLIEKLPFKLTGAQNKVIEEVFSDMESEKKMNRLVQGDVGSGKTIIAFISMIKASLAGFQSALIAPTGVLASQHFDSLNELLKLLKIDNEVKIALLTGAMMKSEKDILKDSLVSGEIDIVIGTHALIEEDVFFKSIALIVTDEQHRFGVSQRSKLEMKGMNPDVLVMSATPIPRTLALIIYGDLDISIIDELPPGRVPIKTFMINSTILERMYGFIRKNIDEGRQVYIVCPMIEENEDFKLRSAEAIYEELRADELKDYSLALLHGKMTALEKDEVLRDFYNGKIDVLVSTTVIEVGVNVPNANIMSIYDADRFGLSQLHQLRGRVGRGNYESFCILINDNRSEISYQRMKILESTNDGFKISEKDFELRGMGDVFGTRQHGIPDLRFVNLFEDMALVKEVEKICLEIFEEDPKLNLQENSRLKKEVRKFLKKLEKDNISFN